MRNVRAKYIDAFSQGLARRRAASQDVHAEIRLELNGEKRHELYKLLVADAIERDANGVITAIAFTTSTIGATYLDLPILTPLAWQAVTFRCRTHEFPASHLIAWGNRWIYDEAPPLGAQDGLTGIIHSVSQPEPKADRLVFDVDFGSAPFQAFEELIALLASHIEAVLTYGEPQN